MADLWYIIQLATEHENLINQLIIVPSTWISVKKVNSKDKYYCKFLECPFNQEDLLFYRELAQKRGIPPAAWKNYEVVRQVGDEAYSFHDAEMQLDILTNGQTVQNSDGSTRVKRLMKVPILPTFERPENQNTNVQGPEGETEAGQQESMLLIKEVDFLQLLQELKDLKKEVIFLKQENEKYKNAVDEYMVNTTAEIRSLKTFIVDKKSNEEREKILELDELIKTHKLDEDFSEGEKVYPLFKTYEKFTYFEENYMTNEQFVADLKKYFYTTINPSEYYVKEILRILKIFFDSTFLHDKFVGSREGFHGKKAFKSTKLAQILTQSLLKEYKGRKWSGTYNKQIIKDDEITDKAIFDTYGFACTRCVDWGDGRTKRGKRSYSELAVGSAGDIEV